MAQIVGEKSQNSNCKLCKRLAKSKQKATVNSKKLLRTLLLLFRRRRRRPNDGSKRFWLELDVDRSLALAINADGELKRSLCVAIVNNRDKMRVGRLKCHGLKLVILKILAFVA